MNKIYVDRQKGDAMRHFTVLAESRSLWKTALLERENSVDSYGRPFVVKTATYFESEELARDAFEKFVRSRPKAKANLQKP